MVASALLVAGPAFAAPVPPADPTCSADPSVPSGTTGGENQEGTTGSGSGAAPCEQPGEDSGTGGNTDDPATEKPQTPGTDGAPGAAPGAQTQSGPSAGNRRLPGQGQQSPAATKKQQRTGDQNCPDFANQREAQQYFESIGGSATNNADRLDANHNGIACEDYFDDGDNQNAAVTSTGDDGSEAKTSGDQVTEVPEGSAQTGGF
ncbi:excalibur calcium-binding domain-containing protein [Actinomycetospora termitidis]|uniref:Excalibur calcium-binding domain-containing protein n=1 Tax=Actinomycetospora termitidis TaxID=3053470 RepID=A0ABT7MHL5_9PSEU|nr:excalibur calcium-binding domain-containing protein [Actinomycetospora sp. Odt1-22]MDL5160173.1 excalibur calcium-binding domain-containing protein [Actinomycetospora sp. Odt1-22]